MILARQKGKWLSYAYVFEPKPGVLWITTMQGGLRLEVDEAAILDGGKKTRPPGEQNE